MPLQLLGVPFYWGKPNPTVRLGPEFLRQNHFLKGLPHHDHGDIDFSILGEITPDNACQLIHQQVGQLIKRPEVLALVGGDHGMGLGTVHALLQQRPDTIVIWLDAHADMNTPSTSPTGNFHGMPLSYLLPFKERGPGFEWLTQVLPPSQLVLVGVRDLDPAEKRFIQNWDIPCYTTSDVREWGMQEVLRQALQRVDPQGLRPIHLSADVDAMDPSAFASTGTQVPGGISAEEFLAAFTVLTRTHRLRSLELVEFAPINGATKANKASASIIRRALQEVSGH